MAEGRFRQPNIGLQRGTAHKVRPTGAPEFRITDDDAQVILLLDHPEQRLARFRVVKGRMQVNHCPLKEAAFANKFCSPIEGSQSLLDWASLGR